MDLPMLVPQSAGFGTSAGDQQYVTGTRSVSRSLGASDDGTGSRSIVSLQSLMTSPSLPTDQLSTQILSYESRQLGNSPLPRHPLHQPKRSIIRNPWVDALPDRHVRQGMREVSRARPRHGEHNVKRHRECLRAVHMRETRGIRDDGVRHEGRAGRLVWVDTRPPTALQYRLNHYPLLLYIAG